LAHLALLEGSGFSYARVMGLVWASPYGLLFPTKINAEAGGLLAELVTQQRKGKPLVLNCHGLSAIDNHAVSSLRDALSTPGAEVLFTDASGLETSLETMLGRSAASFPLPVGDMTQSSVVRREGNERILVYGGGPTDQSAVQELTRQAHDLEREEVNRLVRQCYRRVDRRMHSTPLKASGIFNARSLISDPRSFMWVSLLLGDLLEQALKKRQLRRYRVLAVSLRGSPFAASVALIHARRRFEVEIIDHLGPKHKILEEYTLRKEPQCPDYVYVADFIVGGTELKIASTYAHTKGARVAHALAIGSALEPDAYSTDEMQISCLLNLRKCVPELELAFLDRED